MNRTHFKTLRGEVASRKTIRTEPRAVVFDFDGTLVDSMNAFADIASAVMPKHYPIDAEKARLGYFETSGLPFFQQLEDLFPGHPANPVAAEEYEQAKVAGYFDEPLFEDAAETISKLRERGIAVIVSSNNFQHLVEEFVQRSGIVFDMVLGFKPGFAKGADHFRHIEKEMGISRNAITFVGDSIKDGERAADFGITFIAKKGIFTRERFAAEFPNARVISNLAELKTML
ncbi:MAG: HAD family hydrolase [bacterium]